MTNIIIRSTNKRQGKLTIRKVEEIVGTKRLPKILILKEPMKSNFEKEFLEKNSFSCYYYSTRAKIKALPRSIRQIKAKGSSSDVHLMKCNYM